MPLVGQESESVSLPGSLLRTQSLPLSFTVDTPKASVVELDTSELSTGLQELVTTSQQSSRSTTVTTARVLSIVLKHSVQLMPAWTHSVD